MARAQALTCPPDMFNMPIKTDEVYGVVIDMPMTQELLVSMVCFINGAANLYFNSGSEYSGASTRYRNLVQVTRALVANATALTKQCDRVKAFDLPMERSHFVHLITKRGVYKTVLDPMKIGEATAEMRGVYSLYMRVMEELRSCQLKDQAFGSGK